jgi:hypothetical protein
MNTNTITEATIVNIELLDEISEIILSELPDSIDKNTKVIIEGYYLSDDLKKIYKKYKKTKYQKALIKVASTDYVFTFGKTKSKDYGYYDASNAKIIIHLYNSINYRNRDINKLSKSQIMNTRNVKSTLVHELRHLFQYSEYPEYFSKDLSNQDYKKSKVEIDAAFTHIIQETDPFKYELPNRFAQTVMVGLIHYKDLTDKQIKHYHKKAIDYFYQFNKKIETESVNDFIKSVFDDKEYKNPKDFLKDVLIGIYGVYFKRNMITTVEEKRDYNYIVDSALKYYRSQKVVGEEIVMESTSKTLYHGTLKTNLPSIMTYGVEPKTGKFTKTAYDEYIDSGIELPELVFAADKSGLQKTISSIIGAMRTSGIRVDAKSFIDNAALVVFKRGEDYFKYRPEDDLDNEYLTVEPGDYYREYNWFPDYVLTGKKLLRFLRKNGINLENRSLDISGQKDKYIKDILKTNPKIDKTKLINMSIEDLKKLIS